MIRFKLLIFFIVLSTLNAIGQVKTIGTPHIHSYEKSEYDAGSQNWGIEQGDNQFMYFANNEGVLQFDGLHWDLIEVSPASPVRSVLTTSEDRIFAGLFNDFGILERNESNRYLLEDSD